MAEVGKSGPVTGNAVVVRRRHRDRVHAGQWMPGNLPPCGKRAQQDGQESLQVNRFGTVKITESPMESRDAYKFDAWNAPVEKG